MHPMYSLDTRSISHHPQIRLCIWVQIHNRQTINMQHNKPRMHCLLHDCAQAEQRKQSRASAPPAASALRASASSPSQGVTGLADRVNAASNAARSALICQNCGSKHQRNCSQSADLWQTISNHRALLRQLPASCCPNRSVNKLSDVIEIMACKCIS